MRAAYFSLLFVVFCVQHTHSQLRVISLSPNTTAIIYDLLQLTPVQTKTKLIATIYYPNAPPYYQQLESVGRFQALDINKILTLKPDAVITWQNQTSPQIIALLRRFGLTVKIFNAETLNELGESFKAIANTIGLAQNGIKLHQQFHKKLTVIKQKRQKYLNHTAQRVFFQISSKPMFTIGGTGILNDVIALCGGQNIFQAVHQASFEVNRSAVLMANPDIIIQLSDNAISTKDSPWSAWPFLKAIQSGQLFYLPSAIISQYSPSMIIGVQAICSLLSDQKSKIIESYLKCTTNLCLHDAILFPKKHQLSTVV